MFLPGNQTAAQEEEAERRKAYQEVEQLSLSLLAEEKWRQAVQISVQEVQCGDPNCAPIDTIVTIIFESGGRGMFGLPMEAKEVTCDELKLLFPTNDVLQAWYEGKTDVDWPPQGDMATMQLPQLRFSVGTLVSCRIGADPITGWAHGKIIKCWYREPNWPPNSWAPYQVLLEDGREIYAPGDMDAIIKLRPQVDETASATNGAANGATNEPSGSGGMLIVD